MSDNRFPCGPSDKTPKPELICIEANRVLDSCKDRDCYEDVQVLLTDFGNNILEHTTNVRAKSACITGAHIGIEPVKFNRGFYSINIKLYVKILLEGCMFGGRSQEFEGIAVLEKRVVLYGGESNVNVFRSNFDSLDYCAAPSLCCVGKNTPEAVLELVDPIILNSKVKEAEDNCCKCCCCCADIPESISGRFGSPLSDSNGRYVTVSLGVFSVIKLIRSGQYLINATEYCIPDKECISSDDDDPCALFRSMAFPASEFCAGGFVPSHYNDRDKGGKCGCGN